MRIEHGLPQDRLQIHDGITNAFAHILYRSFGCGGRGAGCDKTIFAFDHIEQHGARIGRADIYSKQ